MNVRGFAALARMHRFRLDQHRRKAAEVEAMRAQFIDEGTRLAQELQREKTALAPEDLAMTDFGAYLERLESRHETLAKSITDASHLLARIGEQMAHEYREAKKFELALEREAKRRKKLADKREQAELDEIGLTYFGRSAS